MSDTAWQNSRAHHAWRKQEAENEPTQILRTFTGILARLICGDGNCIKSVTSRSALPSSAVLEKDKPNV